MPVSLFTCHLWTKKCPLPKKPAVFQKFFLSFVTKCSLNFRILELYTPVLLFAIICFCIMFCITVFPGALGTLWVFLINICTFISRYTPQSTWWCITTWDNRWYLCRDILTSRDRQKVYHDIWRCMAAIIHNFTQVTHINMIKI